MRFYTSVKCVGNRLYVRGVDEGVRYQDIVEFQPTLYLKSKTKTDYKSLTGEYLTPVKQPSIKDTRKFLDKYKDVDGFNVYGNESPVYQYIADNFPGKIEFSMKDVKIFYVDIETTSEYGGVDVEAAQEQILLITIFDYNSKKSITFGSRQFSKKLDNNYYVECANEQDLLEKFLQFWEKRYPDVVSGWNIETFDIPYLVKRIQKTLGSSDANRLSPWKFVRQKNIIDRKTNKENEAYDIYGVNVLDYLPYFKKYAGTNVENHRLDTVTTEVLGESKIDHAEYETFAEFYTKDWDLFVEYNIVDTVLIDKLESKMRLLQLAMTLALDSKVNPDDTLSQGRMWDSIIYSFLLDRKIIIPTKTASQEKGEKYKGAFVQPPQTGKFNWVASFDVSSLYPSLIRTFNISPETLVKERNNDVSIDSIVDKTFVLKEEHSNYSICANGSMYSNEQQGFLPKIMEEMFNERSAYKKLMIEYQKQYQKTPTKDLEEKVATYKIFQESKKQCLNSAYGSLGNEFFRFYDIRNAEAITYTGQAVIRTVANQLNAYLQKVSGRPDIDMILAGDTDSTFLYLAPIVDKVFKDKNPTEEDIVNFLCSICDNNLQKVIDAIFADIIKTTNAFENHMHMKREKICASALWKAKKNYILNVWDNEGVRFDAPKIKISGIEGVKTSNPSICRQKIKTAIEYVMSSTEDELIQFIDDFKKEFFSLPPEDVSFPRSVSNIDKWMNPTTTYIKGTPKQARSAILYNKYIKEQNLIYKYPLIKNGEKIKYCCLKMPNPSGEDVIGFVQRFPEELGLKKYVDYDLHFEITFLQPLSSILNVIGWRTEKTLTLDDLF